VTTCHIYFILNDYKLDFILELKLNTLHSSQQHIITLYICNNLVIRHTQAHTSTNPKAVNWTHVSIITIYVTTNKISFVLGDFKLNFTSKFKLNDFHSSWQHIVALYMFLKQTFLLESCKWLFQTIT